MATLAGVSVATASRALSRARRVNPDLQAQVLTAARELGYAPKSHARALAHSLDTSVGVVVHDLNDPYFSEIVAGMQEVAVGADKVILVCSTNRDPERELAYIAHFRAQRVQALVLVGSGREDRDFAIALAAQISAFEARCGQAALIGRHRAPADSVLPDNFGGARAIGLHLARLGHARVGVISGPAGLTTVSDRLAGFRQGLEEGGVEFHDDALEAGDFTRRGGEVAARTLLERTPSISALFCVNDLMAAGALSALRQHGLRIPEDLSLAGFDDVPGMAELTPGLTTVRMPMREMGATALRMAIEPRRHDFRIQHMMGELIVRDSTGTAPKNRRAA